MKKLISLNGIFLLMAGCAGGELIGTNGDHHAVGQADSATSERSQNSVDDMPGQRPSDLDMPVRAAPLTNVDEAQLKSAAAKEAYARCGAPLEADVEFISARSITEEREIVRSRYVLVVSGERDILLNVTKDIDRLCLVAATNAALVKVRVESAVVKNLTVVSLVGRDQFDIVAASGSRIEGFDLALRGSATNVKIQGEGAYSCPILEPSQSEKGSILDCQK